ncbi:acyl-protein synthetase [Brevibacillus ginsengisoli]|uniref:LuxE/PaaK family acyltransferase n=1 Tax=Brevibacillus ginsengisoli TaxID=363854 RepID=UPI003CE8C884
MNIEHLFTDNPYQLERSRKQEVLQKILNELTIKHMTQCEAYRSILSALPPDVASPFSYEQIPMLPVRMFKLHELFSVPRASIIKTLTSSGTTSQTVSRIYLDKDTASLQTKALVSILKSFIGHKRYPMILVDSSDVIKNRSSFSARGAGLLGLAFVGKDHFYLLDENMNVKLDDLQIFLDKHKGQQILIFGFTFMIWQYFYLPLLRKNLVLNLNDSILIHSGGWKKLTELAVDNPTFKNKLQEQFGIKQIHNFYGMVEQIGSVFMECDQGHLHAPDFADIIVRDPYTLQPLLANQTGIVQVLSVLPNSYPGHSLLTEDLGTVLGEDDCKCGRKGKYFTISGRLPASELRGCSDTHAYNQVNE